MENFVRAAAANPAVRQFVGNFVRQVAPGAYDTARSVLASSTGFGKGKYKARLFDTIKDSVDSYQASTSEPPSKRLRLWDSSDAELANNLNNLRNGNVPSRNMPYFIGRRAYGRYGRRSYYPRRLAIPRMVNRSTSVRYNYRPGWSNMVVGYNNMRRDLKPELKFYDGFKDGPTPIVRTFIQSALTPFDSPNNRMPLNALAQGSDGSERIGLRICCKSLFFRCEIRSGETQNICINVRCIVYIDRQANGSSAASSDLLVDATTGVNNPTLMPLNLTNSKRFKILRDFMIPVGTPEMDIGCYGITKYIKLPNVVSQYTGAEPTYTNINTNAIWVVFFSDYDAADPATNVPSLDGFYSRLRYTDP